MSLSPLLQALERARLETRDQVAAANRSCTDSASHVRSSHAAVDHSLDLLRIRFFDH